MSQSELEAEFEFQLKASGIGGYVHEFRFHPTRKWRIDFAWPSAKIGVEINGFGHHKLSRYTGDVEKGNEAVLLGWRLLHVTTAAVHDLSGLALVERVLGIEEK